VTGTFETDGSIDPSAGRILDFIGKKGSGKSVYAMYFAKNFPGDIVVIDVAGDDGPVGPDVVTITGKSGDPSFPPSWPEHARLYIDGKPQRMILRYIPDPGSDMFLADCDAIVGLAMAHGREMGRCLLLVHEIGVIAPANRTQPNMRRFLMANRHHHLMGALCGPKSMAMDTLILAQADLVFVFELKGVADRQRIAESIGWNAREFSAAVHDLGRHEYLRYDNNEPAPASGEVDRRLVHFDPLPASIVDQVLAWKDGKRSPALEKAMVV
jgi:hypothetical protein